MVADWVAFFINFFIMLVQWFDSVELLGVSVLWIMVISFFLVVMVRSLIFKP